MPKSSRHPLIPFIHSHNVPKNIQPASRSGQPTPIAIGPRVYKILDGIIVLATISYPFLVWFSLDYLQPRSLALLLAGLFLLRLLRKNTHLPKTANLMAPACVVFLLTVALLNQSQWLLAYPVFVSLSFFCVFTYSLAYPPTIVERLARLEDPQLPPKGVIYTRKVTQAWSAFFLINAALSLASVWHGDPWLWSLYNGCVFYILMGLLMLVEMSIRRKVKANF